VYWISPSPVKKGLIWAGTDDGLIWKTLDEGAHWQDVTPWQMSPWSKVGVLDASHSDPKTVYAAIDRHRLDDNHPYIYRTRDGGAHWKLITAGLPTDQFVNVVREDPKKSGLLYAGTDWGVYVSFDDGEHWQSLQQNLPAASVRDIVFGGEDVVVGTHGRAIWVLDDVSLLRHMKATSTDLAQPAPAYLFQRAGTFGFGAFDEGTPFPPEEPQGQNPAWGAVFDYVLDHSTGPVTLSISDARGRRLRRMSSTDRVPTVDLKTLNIPAYWVKPDQTLGTTNGGHRFVWDLRAEDPSGPLVPPGTYSVTLTEDGKSITRQLTVKRDPRLPITDADLRTQYDTLIAIRNEIRVVNDTIDRVNKELKVGKGKLSPQLQSALSELIGTPVPRRRRPKPGFMSLGSIAGVMSSIYDAIGSAPMTPNKEFVKAFVDLRTKASQEMQAVKDLVK